MNHGIVIPCYNEEKRLDVASFVQYAKGNKSETLCFVNDGSSDRTYKVLKDLSRVANSNNIHILNIKNNGGKANAVRRGALYLHDETNVDSVGFLDADLSTSFHDYQLLTDQIDYSKGNLKVVFGSRNMGGDSVIERNPLRKLLSNVVRLLILFIIRIKIADTQCGAKVFHRSLIPQIYSKPFFSKWLFDIEIILRLKARNGKKKFLRMFMEFPLTSWVHMEGSKLGAKDSLLIPMNLLKIWNEYVVKPSIFFIVRFSSNALRTEFISVYQSLMRSLDRLQLNTSYKMRQFIGNRPIQT